MLGLPNEMVWRTELSCGTVALLQSAPHEPPTGVLICDEHDQMVSVVGTVRWDRHLAERIKAQRHAKVAAALAAVSGCPEEWADSDGNSHMCYLLGTPGHQHMCSCGEFAPESGTTDASR